MELKHQNLTAFVGACIDPGRILLLWEYCAKGSLQDVIWNTNIKLDQLFKFALCQDVAKGLEYLHKSHISYHANLKSSNCVVDSRWTCKLTDFGVPGLRSVYKALTPLEETCDKELWTAPEVLRGERGVDFQKADMYALGIILKEVFTRSGPYSDYALLSSTEIINKIRYPKLGVFRPVFARDIRPNSELTSLIKDCWAEDPSLRPTPARVLKTLNRLNPSKHTTVIDNMVAMLEKYANHLEDLVAERTSELDAEKRKTETLLYRVLPQTVAEDLKMGKPVKAESFEEVTIYFSDIVGFTKICAESTPIEVVNLLNSLYTLFDDIITRYDVYKVETIGDAYMLASGLPKRNGERHIKEIADCAMDIMGSIGTFCIPHLPGRNLMIRIGIHTGSVVAGVVGLTMPRYCLFGDTVNTASRMESTGLPMKIHLSNQAHDKLTRFNGYHLVPRGSINVKGKGQMSTYFLTGRDGFYKLLPDCADYAEHTPTRRVRINTGHDKNANRKSFRTLAEMESACRQNAPKRTSITPSSAADPRSKKIKTCSVHSSIREIDDVGCVDVNTLKKRFEPEDSIVSGSFDAEDPDLEEVMIDFESITQAAEALESCDRSSGSSEEKVDNGRLERARQLQMREQKYIHRKLEEIKARGLQVNQLETLFTNPKAENNPEAAPRLQENGLDALEMTSNIIFCTIAQGMRRLEYSVSLSDMYGISRACARHVAAVQKAERDKTEHRTSPNNSRPSSRPSSPKSDVAVLKEQIPIRMSKTMEVTSL